MDYELSANINVNKNSAAPLYLQIVQQVRALIINGETPPGTKLPPSRHLAKACNVSRETVKEAYQHLIAEGFLESVQGAGTFVTAALPLPVTASFSQRSAPLPLTDWARRITKHQSGEGEGGRGRPLIDFGFGRSYPHRFPYDIWRRLLNRYLSTDDMMLSRYGSVAGFLPLREAIAAYVTEQRSVRCHPHQIVVVNGAQQAFDLLARLFIEPKDSVIIESPGYPDAYELFEAHGAHMVPISVDEDGLPVETLSPSLTPKLIFTTPSNQFPSGGAMPAERRLALLSWANERNAFIIEDDYDGALRYNGRPLASLQGIDPFDRVIYLGTFSKVLFPALRLAYVVLPERLVDPFLQAKRIIDRGAPTLTQAAVADFMIEGHFARHLRQLRQLYGEQRELLVTAVQNQLPHHVSFHDEPAGLHLMLFLETAVDEAALVQSLAQEGVIVTPGASFHFTQPAPPSILLGFSKVTPEAIQEGVHLIAAHL